MQVEVCRWCWSLGHCIRESTHDRLDDFISDNQLDEKCSHVLRSLDMEHVRTVLAQGFDVSHCRNPSAVVMSRIQKLDRGVCCDSS